MYLVDSHVLMWMFDDDSRLGDRARARIKDSVTFGSVASLVELTVKRMAGKLSMPEPTVELIRSQGLQVLDIRGSHATALNEFTQLARHDPFDRILLGQASAEGLTFLTSDRRLLALGYEWIVDAGV